MMLSIGSTLVLAIATAAAAPDSARSTGPEYASEAAIRAYALGRLLEAEGDVDGASREYFRALVSDDQGFGIARRVAELSSRIGRPDQALEFADRTLALRPRDSRALWIRGAALVNLGRDEEALIPLEAAVAADSERVEYWWTLARAAEKLGRGDRVARACRRVVWLDDGDAEAWFQLAASEARLGRFTVADSVLLTAESLNPLRPGLSYMRGWVAEVLGRLSEARTLYERHLITHAADRGARRRLIMLLARARRFDDAVSQARLLTRRDPEDPEAIQLEAEMSFLAGEEGQAMAALDRLRSLHPDDERVVAIRIELLGRHGRSRQAATEAEAWRSGRPNDMTARLLAARGAELDGGIDRARDLYLQAVRQAPDSLAPRVLLARMLQARDRLAEAEEVWTQATQRFPEIHALLFDLAVCRERRGDMPGAEAAIRDVLARDPENAKALNFLGYLFADQGRNLAEAVELILRALAREPDNGAFLDSLGWAYYRLGRLVEARVHLERAVQINHGDPVIHEHLGDVYKDMRLKALARDQYRTSLAADGSNSRVKGKLSELR